MFQVGAVIDSGRASAGAAATLTDATKVWGTNLLAGFLVRITSGTGVNQIRQISSNTATALTVSDNWTTNPDATSEYAVFLAANVTVTLNAGDLSIGNVAIENAAGDANAPVSSTNGLAVYLPSATVTTLTPPTAAAIGTAVAAPTAAAIATAQFTPAGLTFSVVKIDQTAGAGVTALKADLASNYTRLHALVVRMEAAGTLTVEDTAAGGTDLSGPFPVAAYGGVVIPFTENPNGCIISTVAKGLAINTSQKVYGYAIVSQGTA